MVEEAKKEDEEYGDFEESGEEGSEASGENGNGEGQTEFVRARMPRQGQFIGVVEQRLGGNRMDIKCSDGKNRNCRVPGRLKRKFWLRQGDFVLVEPWPDDDNKADITFQYSKGAANQLRKKGLLNFVNEGF